jgi:menaquinone-dependent protoporphyrinogen oxidase
MRVLVVVASRHGATEELGQAIAEALRGHDLEVLLGLPTDPDLADRIDGVDAVVLGSAVYRQRWLDPAVDLIRAQAAALRSRPVWLFSSGPVGNPSLHDGPQDLADLMESSGARGHRMFGGRLDSDDLDRQEREIVAELGVEGGDYRDWAAVRGWAEQVAEELASV